MKKFYILLCLIPILASCSSKRVDLEIAHEYPKIDEAKTIKDLSTALIKDISQRYKNSKMLRDAHPKAHGCVRAKFIVPDLPKHLKIGLFSHVGQYDAWIRYSSASQSVDDDREKTMLGMAIKILGVKGKKLLEDKSESNTQDILLLSNPVLPIRNAEDFLKVVNSKVLFFINPFHFHELKIAMSSRKNHPSPLSIRYWSTTPYLFGEGRAVKYSAVPCSTSNRKLPTNLSENYLKDAMKEQLTHNDICFDIMVQFQKDPYKMPIEDATIVWDENLSPFQKVAKIIIPKQKFDFEDQINFCENISMNPWHSLVEHRPLGSINRARRDVYNAISKFRHEKNGI